MSYCAQCGVERADGRELCPYHTLDGSGIDLPDALEELRREVERVMRYRPQKGDGSMRERNAIIERVDIVIEDHGILTVWLTLSWLEGPAGHFIRRVLEVAGVRKWEHVVGKAVRVRSEGADGSLVIGHIVEDDWWFDPAADFKSLEP
jgi:hypothetical protein